MVRVYCKPFVDWIWGGCLLMALGGALAASDRRYRAKAPRETVAARLEPHTVLPALVATATSRRAATSATKALA
jgi:hypothetical protein